jgi:hypothetical protein
MTPLAFRISRVAGRYVAEPTNVVIDPRHRRALRIREVKRVLRGLFSTKIHSRSVIGARLGQ